MEWGPRKNSRALKGEKRVITIVWGTGIHPRGRNRQAKEESKDRSAKEGVALQPSKKGGGKSSDFWERIGRKTKIQEGEAKKGKRNVFP